MSAANYTEDNIRSLDWKEHIRLRPGMYIGKIGDGSSADDGIYILVKEIIDNSIDEYVMGNGKKIEITIKEGVVNIRDYEEESLWVNLLNVYLKLIQEVSMIQRHLRKLLALNGVGTKAVNALSSHCKVYAVRDGQKKRLFFLGENF